MNKADNTASRIIYILTWIFRILLGGTFIFSGFVKAIDPWGSLYKFEEYMAAMGMRFAYSTNHRCFRPLCI